MITKFKIFEELLQQKVELLTSEGKPTKLTPYQYEQVNTDEFKKWFGNSVLKQHGEPIVYYHQTSKENEKSIYMNGFSSEEKYMRARSSDSEVPDGVFFKKTSEDISVGASGKEAVQIPVFLKFEKPKYFEHRYDLIKWIENESDEYVSLKYKEISIDTEYGKSFDYEWNKKYSREDYAEKSKILDVILNEWKTKQREIAKKCRELITDTLKKKGYDSAIIRIDSGGFKREVYSLISLYPDKQIKLALENNEQKEYLKKINSPLL